jgi:MoaA/NifB/PqqE/SkfB family radical SAM enzyme
MSITVDTKEDLAKEIYYNGVAAVEWQMFYPTWQEFMDSEDFDDECLRLRSKFD